MFAEDKIKFEVTAGYFSKYIWRGQSLDDGPVFQPSISLGYKGLTAGIWGNLELTNVNGNSGDFSELDYSMHYSGAIPGVEGVRYCLGVIYYDFPGTAAPDTTELCWGLNLDLPFSPSITLYHDVDEADGTYVLLSLTHGIENIAELAPNIPVGLEIGASLGWGSKAYDKYYWATDQSKFNDLVFSLSFPVEVSGWTITPALNYVTLVSDDIRDTDVYGTDSDFFFAGAGVSRRF